GAGDPADAARRIAVPSAGASGPVVPAAAGAITLDAAGDTDRATVTAWLRTGDGRDLGLALQPRGSTLTAAVPAGLPAPTRLFALALAEPLDYATLHQHHIGEGGTDVAVLSGTPTLGVPRFCGCGHPMPARRSWPGRFPRRRSIACPSTCARRGRTGSPATRWPAGRPAC